MVRFYRLTLARCFVPSVGSFTDMGTFIVLVTGQLAQEIKVIGRALEHLYGVLDEDNLNLH
jgi:hypothetical protein